MARQAISLCQGQTMVMCKTFRLWKKKNPPCCWNRHRHLSYIYQVMPFGVSVCVCLSMCVKSAHKNIKLLRERMAATNQWHCVFFWNKVQLCESLSSHTADTELFGWNNVHKTNTHVHQTATQGNSTGVNVIWSCSPQNRGVSVALYNPLHYPYFFTTVKFHPPTFVCSAHLKQFSTCVYLIPECHLKSCQQIIYTHYTTQYNI